MAHDGEIRRRVEQACVEIETDLRAFLLGVLRDRDLVDEAFQRTVLNAIEASASARPATIRGWLFRIALNEARRLRRDQARHARLVQRVVWLGAGSAGGSSGSSAMAGLVSREQADAVREKLQQRPEDQRTVVLRRIELDQTFAEIAADLNCPVATVITRMRRALTKLRESAELNELLNDP